MYLDVYMYMYMGVRRGIAMDIGPVWMWMYIQMCILIMVTQIVVYMAV